MAENWTVIGLTMEIAIETHVVFHALLLLVKFPRLKFNGKSYSSFRVVNMHMGGRKERF